MDEKLQEAISICKEAGALALEYFERLGSLKVDRKGAHDLVSEADLAVEDFIRKALLDRFPGDGIIGEEYDPIPSASGFTWIIDPIDGTSNFLSGRPHWCVVLAGVNADETQIGVIFDPCHGELYSACRGHGAELNGNAMCVAQVSGFSGGAIGIGHSRYSGQGTVGAVLNDITQSGGTFIALGSGALSIAYVACGRTIGHCEGFMRAWDCLAALLMVEEAGGMVEGVRVQDVIRTGTRIIVASPQVFDALQSIGHAAFGDQLPAL